MLVHCSVDQGLSEKSKVFPVLEYFYIFFSFAFCIPFIEPYVSLRYIHIYIHKLYLNFNFRAKFKLNNEL